MKKGKWAVEKIAGGIFILGRKNLELNRKWAVTMVAHIMVMPFKRAKKGLNY